MVKHIVLFKLTSFTEITYASHSWDSAIDSVFDTEEDLLIYQRSPEHLDAIKKASVIAKEKAMVDYRL
jgi:hypothetical protein